MPVLSHGFQSRESFLRGSPIFKRGRFQGRDVLEMPDSNSPWPDRSVNNICVDVAIILTQALPKMYPAPLSRRSECLGAC